MKSVIAWIKSLFAKSVKVEPLPKVNEPVKEVPKVEMPKLEPVNTKLEVLGVDVSHHNNDRLGGKHLDFKAMVAAGYDFVGIKATQGGTYKDNWFKRNYDDARASGMKVFAYHFYSPGVSPITQANNFLDQVKGCKFDLTCCVDWEEVTSYPFEKQMADIEAFIRIVNDAGVSLKLIYTGNWFFEKKSGGVNVPVGFQKYKLWISDYGKNRTYPRMPKPWVEYAIWQYTEDGVIPGVSNKFDLNRVKPSVFKGLGVV